MDLPGGAERPGRCLKLYLELPHVVAIGPLHCDSTMIKHIVVRAFCLLIAFWVLVQDCDLP